MCAKNDCSFNLPICYCNKTTIYLPLFFTGTATKQANEQITYLCFFNLSESCLVRRTPEFYYCFHSAHAFTINTTSYATFRFMCIQESFYISRNASCKSLQKAELRAKGGKENIYIFQSLFKNRQHTVNATGLLRGIYVSHE